MKVNLKKIGAIVAGATILASSVAFAGLWYGNTELVNANGQPVAKVVVGEKAMASDGVAAANIAAKLANEAYKSKTLTAQVKGTAACTAGTGAGTCSVSDEKVTLEVTVPGSVSTDVATVNSLIGDLYSRTLIDRGAASQDTYPMTTSETSTEANPFANGVGSYVGQNVAKLYRVDGTQFSSLKEYSFEDKDAGKSLKEYQAFYMYGNTQYRAADDQVDARLTNFVYQVKFTNDNYGIPLCSDSSAKNWAYCLGTSYAGTEDVNKQLGTHKVKIKFLGGDWVITRAIPPTYSTAAPNETVVVHGGEVDLASEAVSGIVNVGDVLEAANGYKVKLDDIQSASTTSQQNAIISILDSAGTVIKQTTVAPGNSITYTTSDGTKIVVRVYKTAPGYTFGAKWADMALINNELILKDGESPEVNGDTTTNQIWKAVLGWKNKDVDTTTSAGNQSDHLRSILLYHDGATDYMKKGDSMDFLAKPVGYKVTFAGLNLVDSDYDTLKFDQYDGDFSFVPDGNTSSVSVSSTSYVKIMSSVDSAFSTTYGTGKELVVLFDAGTNRRTTLLSSASIGNSQFSADLVPGATLLKLSNGKYVYVGHVNETALEVDYQTAGSAATSTGGGVLLMGYGMNIQSTTSTFNYSGTGMADIGAGHANFSVRAPSSNAGGNDTVAFVVLEDAGEGLSAQKPDALGFFYQLSTKSFNKDSADTTRYAKDKFTWASVQNVSGTPTSNPVPDDIYGNASMPTTEEIGFVTERGTLSYDKTDSTVTVKVPKKVAYTQLLIAPSGVETSSTKQIFTGGEGAEFDAGQGVKIKVKEITEKVGACSVGTSGAPLCTADMTGVTATIMPDDVATLEAAVPYKLTASLVVLDKDAVDTDTVVTVGGPVVNTVTKTALEGSTVDFTATPKVVKEVVAGKKIVVAGLTASDTLEAAKEFIAALKNQ